TFVSLALHETDVVNLRHTGRAMLPLIMFFALIVWESTVRRSADQHIAEVIDEERHTARRMVLKELGLLLPAMAAAAVGLWVMASYGDIADRVHRALHAAIEVPGVAMMRDWRPLWGLATAATGYLIAGGVGWLVRIVFTLAFGREAFGTGDIHLMAAAGCVAGWPVVVLGFFLTCLLAMVGWLVALPFKRSRALPLGPWLALSFLTVVVYYDSLIRLPVIDRAVQAVHLLLS
ncbi:MAG: hypothetical protein ACE5EX_11830, partial [Phycisphaerae bacterium]